MNKLKSFTLIELIVALVISSVVILLSFWFLTNSQHYLYVEEENLSSKNQSLTFLSRFERDVAMCDYIEYKNHGFDIITNDSVKSSYYLEDDFIVVEKDNVNDTLFAEISNIDTICVYNKLGLIIIQDILFEIELKSQKASIIMHKEYYSKFLHFLKK